MMALLFPPPPQPGEQSSQVRRRAAKDRRSGSRGKNTGTRDSGHSRQVRLLTETGVSGFRVRVSGRAKIMKADTTAINHKVRATTRRVSKPGGASRPRGNARDPARVVTETVTAAGPAPLGMKGFGETVHCENGGPPMQPNAMGWLNPLTVATF